jgi:hypothetical protein
MWRSHIFIDVYDSSAYVHVCKAEMDHPHSYNLMSRSETPMDTTFDDAFVAGWYFGRGKTSVLAVEYKDRIWSVPERKEYERGVYEGHVFQQEWDAAIATV